MEIDVKIKLSRGAQMPEYATAGSAALDLRAALEGGRVVIAPGERAMIPTGIAISPGRSDVVAIIAARSGLGAKNARRRRSGEKAFVRSQLAFGGVHCETVRWAGYALFGFNPRRQFGLDESGGKIRLPAWV